MSSTVTRARRTGWKAGDGVFALGRARFLGSTGANRLNQPIVGLTST